MILLAAGLAGCSPPPAEILKSALAKAATTPHRFGGKATRTLSPVGAEFRQADPVIVSWEVKGAFAAPYASVELTGLAGKRRAIGREGWWSEPYEEVWRAYPPPYESIEWLDPAGLTAAAEYGPDQTVGGVACRRVRASHQAGTMSFDIAKDGGRLMRVQGGTTDGKDVYEFDLVFDWSEGKVEVPDGARILLEALAGAKGSGDDPAAKEAVQRAWSVLPRTTATVTTIQIDFLNAAELRRRSGYLEQDPPLRAWNIAENGKNVFLFSDGVRSVASDSPDGALRETPTLAKPVLDDLDAVTIVRAAFAGESDHRGTKCRLVAAEILSRSAEKGTTPSVSWFWIGPDGRLLRQLMVGKATMAGEGARELTTVADVTLRPDPADASMRLLKRAREIFKR